MTGKKASEEEIDKMIETGESENIFQKAIMEQGRGHVSVFPEPPHLAASASYALLDTKSTFKVGQRFIVSCHEDASSCLRLRLDQPSKKQCTTWRFEKLFSLVSLSCQAQVNSGQCLPVTMHGRIKIEDPCQWPASEAARLLGHRPLHFAGMAEAIVCMFSTIWPRV